MRDFCPHGYDEEQIKRDYCKACSINKIKDLEKKLAKAEKELKRVKLAYARRPVRTMRNKRSI